MLLIKCLIKLAIISMITLTFFKASSLFVLQRSGLSLSLIRTLLFQNELLISAGEFATVINSGFMQAKAEEEAWQA